MRTASSVLLVCRCSAAIAVRPGESVALADALVDLLRDPARLVRMGNHARQRVLETFDAPVVCHRFMSIYEDAIGIFGR